MSDQPKAPQGIIQKRDQLIQELETWYFGVPFREWHQKTEVGMWRDILIEACRRMVDLQSELEDLRKQNRELTMRLHNNAGRYGHGK